MVASFKVIPKIRFLGDVKRAKKLFGRGRAEFDLLTNLMDYQKLKQHKRQVIFSDGAIITISKYFNEGLVDIFVPVVEVVKVEEGEEYTYKPYLMYLVSATYDGSTTVYMSMYDLVNGETVTDYMHPNANPGDPPVVFPTAYDSVIWFDPSYMRVTKTDLFKNSINPKTWDFVAVNEESAGWATGNGTKRDGATFKYYGADGIETGESGSWETKDNNDNSVSAVGCCAAPALDCVGDVQDGVFDVDNNYESTYISYSFRLLECQTPVGGDFGVTWKRIGENNSQYTKTGYQDVEIYGICYYPYFPFSYDSYEVVSAYQEINFDLFAFSHTGIRQQTTIPYTGQLDTRGDATSYMIGPLGLKQASSDYSYAQSVRNIISGPLPANSDVGEDTTQIFGIVGGNPEALGVQYSGSFYFDDTETEYKDAPISPLNAMLQVFYVPAVRTRALSNLSHYINNVQQDSITVSDVYEDVPEILMAAIDYDINLTTFSPFSQVRDTKLEDFLMEIITYARSQIPGATHPHEIVMTLGGSRGAQLMAKPDDRIPKVG